MTLHSMTQKQAQTTGERALDRSVTGAQVGPQAALGQSAELQGAQLAEAAGPPDGGGASLEQARQQATAYLREVSWIREPFESLGLLGQGQARYPAGFTLTVRRMLSQLTKDLLGYSQRIQGASTARQLGQALKQYQSFQKTRLEVMRQILQQQVDNASVRETEGVEQFITGPALHEERTKPNNGAHEVGLHFQPGIVSELTVETLVKYDFGLTEAATAELDGEGERVVPDWTDEERAYFHAQFQRQLDEVWGEQAQDFDAFRVSSPKEDALSKASLRWSELTAKMLPRVTEVEADPHYTISVKKTASNEQGRASVGGNGKTASFFMANADRGFHTSGAKKGEVNGAQMTLAHEWLHMIGNPDEYAENSASQGASGTTPATQKRRWADALAVLQGIIDNEESTEAQKAQAEQDLTRLRNQYSMVDAGEQGSQRGIYTLSDAVPDDAFAIRGTWAEGPRHQILRPGNQSQRGGSNISASMDDEVRLSDRGNEVRPYMREGVLESLNTLLKAKGKFKPMVQFDHNFDEMTEDQQIETELVRAQNLARDGGNK